MPGINAPALGALLNSPQFKGSAFGLYDIFVGGALGRAAIFSLGIMPYISASIIFQLMGSVFPYLEKLQREEQGRKKINQYTRYLTVGLAILQAAAIAVYLESQRGSAVTGGMDIVSNPGFMFRIITILTLTAGTILVMWLVGTDYRPGHRQRRFVHHLHRLPGRHAALPRPDDADGRRRDAVAVRGGHSGGDHPRGLCRRRC